MEGHSLVIYEVKARLPAYGIYLYRIIYLEHTLCHCLVGRVMEEAVLLGFYLSLDELPLEDYKKISSVFEEDIYEAIRMQTCVERRNTIGAPGLAAMQEVLAVYKDYLSK